MCMFFCRVRSSIDARYMHEILRSLSQHCRPQPSETAACARVWGDVLRSCPTSAPRLPEPRTNNTENHCDNITERTSQAKPSRDRLYLTVRTFGLLLEMNNPRGLVSAHSFTAQPHTQSVRRGPCQQNCAPGLEMMTDATVGFPLTTINLKSHKAYHEDAPKPR
jgi:hypothetical protein